jgi:protein-S-isoprenylcysteine O-methyltransferase Ste14
MIVLENRIPPPVIFIVTGALMWLIARTTFVLDVSIWPRVVVASLLVIAALIGPFAIAAFRRAETTIDPLHIERASTLVTEGAFSYTRNPMYLAMALLLLAWTSILAAPWALLGPIAFMLYITRFQIRPEERAMQAKFGAAYEEYRRKVRRWV